MAMSGHRPNFLIIGAYRSGTTSLRHLLGQHPEVFVPALAEPSFFAFGPDGGWPELLLSPDRDPFSRKRTTGETEYLALFENAGSAKAIGEASPEYLREPGVMERIMAFDPGMRLVVTLRNPVDRLISDYSMHRRDGTEALSLEAALDVEATRRGEGAFGGHYLETSRFGAQMKTVLAQVPRDQVHLMISERWQHDHQVALSELAVFLGIDPSFVWPSLVQRNRSGEPRNRVVGGLFRARRRLQPVLGHRVPDRLKRAADSVAGQGLVSVEISSAVRQRIQDELAGDRRLLESLIGPVPEWD